VKKTWCVYKWRRLLSLSLSLSLLTVILSNRFFSLYIIYLYLFVIKAIINWLHQYNEHKYIYIYIYDTQTKSKKTHITQKEKRKNNNANQFRIKNESVCYVLFRRCQWRNHCRCFTGFLFQKKNIDKIRYLLIK